MGKMKREYTWLKGKQMPCTYFGMMGCSRGAYCVNWETYFYGIRGIFGLRIYKQWGSNW